jgi:hypothetical protein
MVGVISSGNCDQMETAKLSRCFNEVFGRPSFFSDAC